MVPKGSKIDLKSVFANLVNFARRAGHSSVLQGRRSENWSHQKSFPASILKYSAAFCPQSPKKVQFGVHLGSIGVHLGSIGDHFGAFGVHYGSIWDHLVSNVVVVAVVVNVVVGGGAAVAAAVVVGGGGAVVVVVVQNCL